MSHARAQDIVYHSDLASLFADSSGVRVAIEEDKRAQKRLEVALRSDLRRAAPIKDIQVVRLSRESVEPAMVLVHVRSLLREGQIYSLPRQAAEGPVAAITSIEKILTAVPHASGSSLPNDLDMTVEIDSMIGNKLPLPKGKTLFFMVVQVAPSKQRLIHPNLLGGRFSPADCIIHFYQHVPQRVLFGQNRMVPLDAQPLAIATLSLHMLSLAMLMGGLKLWQRENGFQYRWLVPARVQIDELKLQPALNLMFSAGHES